MTDSFDRKRVLLAEWEQNRAEPDQQIQAFRFGLWSMENRHNCPCLVRNQKLDQ
jgi:hypothetical protein